MGRAQGSEDFSGWGDGAAARRNELRNQHEEERRENASKSYFTILLLMKVILSNVVSIYFQGTFFSLSFESTGFQAKIKVLLSLSFSTLVAMVLCKQSASHLGALGSLCSLWYFSHHGSASGCTILMIVKATCGT